MPVELSDAFEISARGEIRLVRRPKSGGFLFITAFESGSDHYTEHKIKIKIENEKVTANNKLRPTFIKNYNFEITEENEKETIVGQLEAFDKDSPDENLKYSAITENYPFKIFENGTIKTTRRLDFEKEQKFQIDVTVSDGLHIVKTTIFIKVLDANDNKPRFEKSSYEFLIWADDKKGTILLKNDQFLISSNNEKLLETFF